MMILRSSPASPFARKARIAARVLGLAVSIEVQDTDLNDPGDSIRVQNPLGKIPALVLDDGTTWFDSRLILEMFDQMAGGGRILPREARARFEALRTQALCDGAMDASVLIVYESRYRPADKRVPEWVDRQAGKVARSLAALEAEPPKLSAMPDVGQIALACLLGYLDLRFDGAWRAGHPRLDAWLDAFAAQVPSFVETRVAA